MASAAAPDGLVGALQARGAALPPIIVSLALIGTLGPSMPALIFALALTGWTPYARLMRSLVLQTRTADFVLAAYALGARQHRLLPRHVLPLVLAPVAVQVSLNVGGFMLTIAGLSFLGLGLQAPCDTLLLQKARTSSRRSQVLPWLLPSHKQRSMACVA